MNKRPDPTLTLSTAEQRNFPRLIVEVEKPHPTVSDSLGAVGEDARPVLQVRMGVGDIWSDFIQLGPEKRGPAGAPRADGGVPLLDEMTGIRQWE
jgi:hypothetical protein